MAKDDSDTAGHRGPSKRKEETGFFENYGPFARSLRVWFLA